MVLARDVFVQDLVDLILVGVVDLTTREVHEEPVERPVVPVPDREEGDPVHVGDPHPEVTPQTSPDLEERPELVEDPGLPLNPLSAPAKSTRPE